MDPITSLAATAVAALAPYLAEAGKEFAKEAGKAAADKIGALYQAVKTHFKNKPAAKEALADLEANPDNEDAQAALRRQLTKQMNSDPTLKDDLKRLLEDIDQDEKSMSFLIQVYGGKVKNIAQIGKVKKFIMK